MVAPAVAAAGKKLAGKAVKKAGKAAAGKGPKKSKLIKGALIALVLSPFAFVAGLVGVIALMVGMLAGSAAADTSCGTECSVSASDQENAVVLVEAWKAGTLRAIEAPDLIEREIVPVASGAALPGCAVDGRLLQILVLVHQKFPGTLTISDMNRPCIGVGIHCEYSPHCTPMPTTAIDFAGVGDVIVDGDNDRSREVLTFLDAIVPSGSMAGQSDCRSRSPLRLDRFNQFPDTCNHLHIDLRGTSAPLTITTK